MKDVIRKILATEPALVRALGVAVVALGTAAGLDVSNQVDRGVAVTIAAIALVAMVQAWWTRPAVTANASVLERVDADGAVIAGAANDLVPEGEEVRTLGEAEPSLPTVEDDPELIVDGAVTAPRLAVDDSEAADPTDPGED